MTTCLVLGFIGVLERGLQKHLLQSNQGTDIEHFRVSFCVTALQHSSCREFVCSNVLIFARICNICNIFHISNVFLISITIDFEKIILIDSDSKNL